MLDLHVTTGSANTTTVLSLTIDSGSGYVNDMVPQEGLVIGDFGSAVQNITTTTSVALNTVTEPTAGNYLLTMAVAQTLGDIIEVTITKNGIETSVTTHTL